jgi:hypothetical protein
MYAAYYGREDVLRELFIAGAEIEFQNEVRLSMTSLRYLSRVGRNDSVYDSDLLWSAQCC